MLGKLSQWLTTRLEDKEDEYLKLRFDALTHLKKTTLDVQQTVADHAEQLAAVAQAAKAAAEVTAEASAAQADSDGSRTVDSEPTAIVLSEADACVHELCAGIDECFKLGLKRQADQPYPSWWSMLYAISMVVDEPTLVQSILTAALLSESDVGKTHCWLKIALNNRTLESSLTTILSPACDEIAQTNYEDYALMRCVEGKGLFLQIMGEIRDVQFSIHVNDDAFRIAQVNETPIAPTPSSTAVDGSAATGVDPNPVVTSSADLVATAATTDPPVGEGEVEDPPVLTPEEQFMLEVSSVRFPHRHKGIKPWQHVFGVSLAYLSKNSYHSRFALIDPVLSIPNIIQDCIDILRENPDTPRLFRATVLNVHVNKLREIVETEGSLPPDLDAHGAGALLIDFFKHLPEPLLTSEKYDAFVASGRLRDEEASIRNIQCLVQEMPVYCKFVLEKVIGLMHFLQLPEHAELNGVDVFSAATVLAPVIAFKNEPSHVLPSGQRRSNHTQHQDLRFAAVGAQVIERMIEHHEVIFQDVRLQVSDALERLNAKKDALRSIHHMFKLRPQVNFLSDRQQLEEITTAFVNHAKAQSSASSPNNPANLSPTSASNMTQQQLEMKSQPLRHRVSMPHIVVPNTILDPAQEAAIVALAAASRTSSGGRRQTVTISAPSQLLNRERQHDPLLDDRGIVVAWETHGFNRPTVLGNFDKGGVLLLRCVAYMLREEGDDILKLLYRRALPTTSSSFDAGLVSCAICRSLVHLLKLDPTPEQPKINIVALSVEPFWELFDEEAYFYKLFQLMFHMFDQIWSSLNPDEASFTRVFCDTEAKFDELLKNSPSSVEDLLEDWEDMWKQSNEAERDEENENGQDDDVRDNESTEEQVVPAATNSVPVVLPPSPPRFSKKPSFTFKPDEYKSKLLSASNILTMEHVAHIDHVLPITCQMYKWNLLYSTEAHGSSLHTLLLLVKGHSPTLLVVKDDQGNVFGGFGSDEWHRSTQYYGNGETFLFTFTHKTTSGSSGFMKYPWSRRNSYFMLCSEESLVLGGGGNFGLYLDSELATGTTGPCETFSSRPLVSSQEFACVQVEVWSFSTGDKNTSQRDLRKRSVLD